MTLKKALTTALSIIAMLTAGLRATPTADGLYAIFDTDKGSFTAELFYDKAPLSCANMVGLAEGTIPHYTSGSDTPIYSNFYDGLTFHRAAAGFVIQGGDPAGNGSGGPGYNWPDEVRTDLTHTGEGILSMANSGPNSNGSQFFVTLADQPGLNGLHNVFGRVVENIETVRTIGNLPSGPGPSYTLNTPVQLNSIRILRIGEAANAFDPTFYAAIFDPTQFLFDKEIDSDLSFTRNESGTITVFSPYKPLADYRIMVSNDLEDWTEIQRIPPTLDRNGQPTSYTLPPNDSQDSNFVRIDTTTGVFTNIFGLYDQITIVSTLQGTEFNEQISFKEGLVADYKINTSATFSTEYDWIELSPGRAQLLIRFSNNSEIQFHLTMTSPNEGDVLIRDGSTIINGTFTLTPTP